MKLSFLVPFRDADGTRTRPMEWILARWRHFYPYAEFVLAPDDGVDPFCKSAAVNAAARQATGDLFAILDADTWVDPEQVAQGMELLERGVCRWFIPARRSLRLTRAFSEELMAVDPTGPLPHIPTVKHTAVEQAGRVAGFLHVLPREGFEAVGGMDERFRGWGGEDTSFTCAVDVVYGKHRKFGVKPLISLWHERPRAHGRFWLGQTDAHNEQRRQVAHRYSMASLSRERMLGVLSEPGGPLA